MPSNIPLRGIRMNDELDLKLKHIAKTEKRSYNQQAVLILEQYVTNYKRHNGTIKVNTDELYEK